MLACKVVLKGKRPVNNCTGAGSGHSCQVFGQICCAGKRQECLGHGYRRQLLQQIDSKVAPQWCLLAMSLYRCSAWMGDLLTPPHGRSQLTPRPPVWEGWYDSPHPARVTKAERLRHQALQANVND